MKVTLTIDDKDMEAIMKYTGEKTKTAAVNKALREYVEDWKAGKIKNGRYITFE